METLYSGLRSATRGMLDLLRDLKLPAPVLNQMRKYTENSSPGQLADLLTSTLDVPLKVRGRSRRRQRALVPSHEPVSSLPRPLPLPLLAHPNLTHVPFCQPYPCLFIFLFILSRSRTSWTCSTRWTSRRA